MARYSASSRMTNAPTSTLPGASLYAVAGVTLKLREVHVWNTTTTGFVLALNRLSTAGTQGAGLTEAKFDPETPTSSGQAFNSHTVAPTANDEYARVDIGAAVGSGVMWTFDAEPIRILAGTANGVGLLVPTGTGQLCDFTFIWDE